jgi:hypothetical protein
MQSNLFSWIYPVVGALMKSSKDWKLIGNTSKLTEWVLGVAGT